MRTDNVIPASYAFSNQGESVCLPGVVENRVGLGQTWGPHKRKCFSKGLPWGTLWRDLLRARGLGSTIT